ncbi:MAG TPA: NADPH-dependent FMN reductase [Candidatus Eisenbacteria bacterium]|nr:NADPH-dependent FMN reductase [Candidatus Eisenbacteria bacterium]
MNDQAMKRTMFLPILLGTVREGRQSENVARLLLERAEAHPEIETQLFDPRNMKFPMTDEGQGLKRLNPDWRDAVVRADGLVIVSPEYNHGYPGSLKMALDILLREYIHKAVGLVGVSRGPWGGTRVIERLVGVVRELGLAVTFTDLNFPHVETKFDGEGHLVDEEMIPRIDAFFTELLWMARTLALGRENVPSQYHPQAAAPVSGT